MPRKSFEAGMEAGAKPFEEKFRKQADAIEKVGSRIDSRLDEISSVMDVMIEDLSAQERKRVYDLNTVVDISELDKTEKDYLCAIVYAIAGLNSRLSKEQKEYLRALKSYLMITNVQVDVSLASIENIDNITTQKAIMQTIMEFLFLEYGNHDYMDDYEDVFDYFSVNRKGIREIQDGIDVMFEAVGIEGIASHYAFFVQHANKEVKNDGNTSDVNKLEDLILSCEMKSAFSLAEYLAMQGNGRAMYLLGEFYIGNFFGAVDKIDQEKAREWRTKGANAGDVLSQVKLGYMASSKAEKNTIFKENFDKVLSMAKSGDVFAMDEVAKLFWSGHGTEIDFDKRDYWLEQAAERKYWRSIFAIIQIEWAKNNYSDVEKYYSWAIENNCSPIVTLAASNLWFGLSCTKNETKGYELYKQAAENGSYFAMRRMGDFFNPYCEDTISAVTKDRDKAASWYIRSALLCPTNRCFVAAYRINQVTSFSYVDGYNPSEIIRALKLRGAKAGDLNCMVADAYDRAYYDNDDSGYDTLKKFAEDSSNRKHQIAALSCLVTLYYSSKKDESTAKFYAKKAQDLGSDIGRQQYDFFNLPSLKKRGIFDRLLGGDNLPSASLYGQLNLFESNIGENYNE